VKSIYTARDIEDMYASGITELEIDDDVVLTDIAREKAAALGVQLKHTDGQHRQTERILRNLGAQLGTSPASDPHPGPDKGRSSAVDHELVEQVKTGVIARLGTTAYNGLLDQVIPQVLARLDIKRST
jgi:hypothetical protein